MAAGEDDVDSGGEDNILYDLAVLAEWKFDNEIFVMNMFNMSEIVQRIYERSNFIN